MIVNTQRQGWPNLKYSKVRFYIVASDEIFIFFFRTNLYSRVKDQGARAAKGDADVYRFAQSLSPRSQSFFLELIQYAIIQPAIRFVDSALKPLQ